MVLSNTLPYRAVSGGKLNLGALLCLAACGLLRSRVDAHCRWRPWGQCGHLFVHVSQPAGPAVAAAVSSYLIATASGLACSHWVSQPILAAALAVALTIWLMARLNCVHPPGGALALLLVLNGLHSNADMVVVVAELIAINAGTPLLLVALLINGMLLRRRYPHSSTAPGPSHRTQTGRRLSAWG